MLTISRTPTILLVTAPCFLNNGAPTTSTYNSGNELITSQTSAGLTTSTFRWRWQPADFSGARQPMDDEHLGWGESSQQVAGAVRDRGLLCVQRRSDSRVQKQDSTGTTNHVWDRQNILLETNASNIIQVVFSLEPLLYGNLVPSRSGVDSFYLFDVVGSTRQLVSGAGSVTDSYCYDSFGAMLSVAGSTVNPFRYIGGRGFFPTPTSERSLRSGTLYSAARGRFLSLDPRGDKFARLDQVWVCVEQPTQIR